jgi:penicillin-binding protein 1C
LYPRKNAQLFIPVEVDGQLSSVIFKAAHREPETTLHWHLDDQYVGSTQTFHQIALQPGVGKHRIAVVDQAGHRIDRNFEVIGKGH